MADHPEAGFWNNVLGRPYYLQSWALEVFLNLFNNKKWYFCIFIKLTTYFCTSPI